MSASWERRKVLLFLLSFIVESLHGVGLASGKPAASAREDCLKSASSDQNDFECLRRFVDEQRFLMMAPLNLCIKLEEDPAFFMDKILVSLAQILSRNDKYSHRLTAALAQVTGFEELLSDSSKAINADWLQLGRKGENSVASPSAIGKFGAQATTTAGLVPRTGAHSRKFTLPSMGLQDLLAAPPQINDDSHNKMNSRIVQSNKQVKDYANIEDAIWNELSSMTKYEKNIYAEAIRQKYGEMGLRRQRRSLIDALKKMTKSRESKAFAGILKQVLKFGIQVLDQLYLSPDFLLRVPVVGDQILKLRQKGQPFFMVVQWIRGVHALYKVSRCPPPIVQNPLTNEDKGNHDDDCGPGLSETKVREAKRMVTDVGSIALTKVASKVSRDYSNTAISEEKTQELISRSAYALLTFLLPESPVCSGIL